MKSTSPRPSAPALSPRQLRQVALLTLGALILYGVMRGLPTGTNLRHADFVAGGPRAGTLEFCDPANPQFLPVVRVRSPVETRVASARPPVAGEPVRFTLTLRTASGKPIAPADLLETHTRRLHVMAVDPTLTDYQHLHPAPGTAAGEWEFELTPQRAGAYRIFCDFTPRATGRGLYSSAEFMVAPGAAEAGPGRSGEGLNWTAERDGYAFTLQPAATSVRARERAELALTIRRLDGGRVPLGEVMGAYAHLVAFDRDRSGFAHLHPRETRAAAPAAAAPRLTFDVTIPESGRYVVWAQVNLAGREIYVPFWFEVDEA